MSEGEEGYHTAIEPCLNEWFIESTPCKPKNAQYLKTKKLEALVATLNETIKVLSDHIGKIHTEVLLMTPEQSKEKLIHFLTITTKLSEENEKRKELLLQKKDIQFTLEEVEQYREQALQCVRKDCNDTTLAKFSAWQTIFDNHPTNVEKQKAEAQAREIRETPKRKEALYRIRAIIPQKIENLTEETLQKMNMPVSLIKRIKKTSLRWLWLVWMPSATIAKLHIGDMINKYAYSTKADIIELRAIVENLPDKMESDPDGKKTEWANTFRIKLNELVMKEEKKEISKSELRHLAWKEVDEKGLQFEDPTADLLSITPTKSGAFDGNKKKEDVNDDNDTSSNNVRNLSQLFNKS